MFKDLKELELFLNQNKVFDLFGLEQIGVFGSFAREEKANDIDLLIQQPTKKHINEFELAEDLKHKSGIKFDIVLEQFAEPIILHRAKKDLRYVQKTLVI